MCYTCGCGLPYEDHGDPRNITEKHFIEAGKTKEINNEGRIKAKQNMMGLINKIDKAGDVEDPKKSY